MTDRRAVSVGGRLADRIDNRSDPKSALCVRCGITIKAHTKSGACRDCASYVADREAHQ